MAKLQIVGMIFLLLAGAVFVAIIGFCKSLYDAGWPHLHIYGWSCCVVFMVILVGLVATKTTIPNTQQLGLVMSRCAFSGARTLLQTSAAVTDAPLGDVAALSSVSVVVATILGFFILGEKLRCVHGVAVGCSFIGALLVSQPRFLFGTTASRGTAWLGYLLAVVSGCCQACVLVAARKQKSVHPQINNAGAHLSAGLLLLAIPYTPLLPGEVSLAPVVAAPHVAIGCVALLALGSFLTSALFCAGSKWCPAALSATLDVCSRLVVGYCVQLALFGQTPQVTTLAGAMLMLASVVIMTCARLDEAVTIANLQPQHLDTQVKAAAGDDMAVIAIEEEEETESLFSFAAAEFVEKSPHMSNQPGPMRQRRGVGQARDPENHIIGAMTSVVAVSSI